MNIMKKKLIILSTILGLGVTLSSYAYNMQQNFYNNQTKPITVRAVDHGCMSEIDMINAGVLVTLNPGESRGYGLNATETGISCARDPSWVLWELKVNGDSQPEYVKCEGSGHTLRCDASYARWVLVEHVASTEAHMTVQEAH